MLLKSLDKEKEMGVAFIDKNLPGIPNETGGISLNDPLLSP